MPKVAEILKMNQTNRRVAFLLGTASVLAIQALPAFGAAPPANDPAEEVLVTGSLIRGAPAVGVPVTSFGAEEFRQTGAITVTDVLKNIPAVQLEPSTSAQFGAGTNTSRLRPIQIHGVGGIGPRSLMLIDGMRYPPQNQDQAFLDPSVVPTLAVSRIDVLSDGASATYGSDALAGVINVILKRRFEGAVTQASITHIRGAEGLSYQASQLYGRTWDSGDITLTWEFNREVEFKHSARPTLSTYDFRPWGLDDRRLVRSAIPGIVSTGTPSSTTGTSCTNCYSIPAGTGWDFGSQAPSPTTNWTTLVAAKGVTNLVNPYLDSSMFPQQERSAIVATFDQEVWPGIELFVDAFYSNRRTLSTYTVNSVAANNYFTETVPTTNPYYPSGAPAGLRVSYTLALDRAATQSTVGRASRYDIGFNLDLPYEWQGKIFFNTSDHLEKANADDIVNAFAVRAALGNTVASSPAIGNRPGIAAFSKPAGVPYLNVFCDSSQYVCNSKETLDYISSYRHDTAHWIIKEWGSNFDGPIFDLPGGTLRAAIGGGYAEDSLFYSRELNSTTPSPSIIEPGRAPDGRERWAAYAQVHVPVIGEMNAVPLIRRFDVELAYRYDHYSDFGTTRNPRLSADWVPFDGLTLRWAWGTSFRAPAFSEMSRFARVIFEANNLIGGGSSNNVPACTAVGGTPTPGSAAAALNPTCSLALQFQGGVTAGQTSGLAKDVGFVPPDFALGPEKSQNMSAGFEYAPTDNFLSGLSVTVSYFFLRIRDNIGTLCNDLNDPKCRSSIYVLGDPDFISIRDKVLAHPATRTPPSVLASDIHFIRDNTVRNRGYSSLNGIDFNARYDWDMANWGAWAVGASGTYFLHDETDDGQGNFSAGPYVGENSTAGFGNSTSSRLRVRGQVGWTDGSFNVTTYINYRSHYHLTQTAPPAAFLANFPSRLQPETYYFDLSVGYNTGDMPANGYLKNINVQLIANDVLDAGPPFAYNTGGQQGASTYDLNYSPAGRILTFMITKTW